MLVACARTGGLDVSGELDGALEAAVFDLELL
jgi:hypothetical protein